MNPLREAPMFPGFFKKLFLLKLVALLVMVEFTAVASDAELPVLEFIQPTNGAVFSTLDEIPIMLRAFASNDVFLNADVFANQRKIATVSYCCAFCPCFRPVAGQE